MLVIGGFNSSNTNHLAVLTAKYTKTYHIDDPECILPSGVIRHKRVGGGDVLVTEKWLSPGDLTLGITAGASTPNIKIGQAIEKVLAGRGVDLADVLN